jgi:hypothetical protein
MKCKLNEVAPFFFGMSLGLIMALIMVMNTGIGLTARIDNSKVQALIKDNHYVSYSETYFNGKLHSVRMSLGQGDETRTIEGKAALKLLEAK